MPSYPSVTLGNKPLQSKNPLDTSETDTGTPSKGKTYEERLTTMGGMVHRWKFNESSGDFNDNVGGLTLTKSGTFTYNVAGAPVGGAVKFGASGKGITANAGSIPTGTSPRTIILIWKPTITGSSKQCHYSYGGASTRLWWTTFLNEGVQYRTALDVFGDDLILTTPVDKSSDDTSKYHMWASRCVDSTHISLFMDGGLHYHEPAAINTTSSAFTIGQTTAGANQLDSAIFDDLAIFNRALTLKELVILYRCFLRASGTT